jgi:hypothetical protein
MLSFIKTQRDKHWFSSDLFLAILRLRGLEANASTGYAEAFYSRKMLFNVCPVPSDFLTTPKDWREHDMIWEPRAEARHEGPEALLVHGGHQREAPLAWTEERGLSGPGSAEPARQAKLLSGLAEQGQQGVCARGQEEEDVSPVVALHHRLRQPQSPPRVLEVSKRFLDRDACAIQVVAVSALEGIAAARRPRPAPARLRPSHARLDACASARPRRAHPWPCAAPHRPTRRRRRRDSG